MSTCVYSADVIGFGVGLQQTQDVFASARQVTQSVSHVALSGITPICPNTHSLIACMKAGLYLDIQ